MNSTGMFEFKLRSFDFLSLGKNQNGVFAVVSAFYWAFFKGIAVNRFLSILTTIIIRIDKTCLTAIPLIKAQ